MRDTPFITRPLSILLDLVRALAALAVLVGHAVQLGHYGGPYPFTMLFQHNAVIIFFVLSGLVITASVDRAKHGPGAQTLASFTVARIARILPVALPALTISLAIVVLDRMIAPVPLFGEDGRSIAPLEILSALLFLSESWQTGFAPNAPYWSLCYEVWFYALFAAATFLAGWKRATWVIVLAAIAGPKVLLLLPGWLVGVALARLPAARAVPAWLGAVFVALAMASLIAVPLVTPVLQNALRELVPVRLHYSTYALSDLPLALCIALGFAGLRALTLGAARWLDPIAPPIRYAANMSFSLYLLHWPLLKLLRVARAPDNGAVGFVFVLAIILLASGVFATITERHRARVRVLIERAFARRRDAPVVA
jgi:peptidoglycan/LPS O-acetylase OafA/YrhL